MGDILTTALAFLVIIPAATAAAMLKAGDIAPEFSALAQDGKNISLSDYRGKKNVVLYFYPKDFTRGCTDEACAFRDYYEKFLEKNAEVIGVSADAAESHKKFAAQYMLPFKLVSDPKGEIAAKYGVNSTFGMLSRVTFIIDKGGIIRAVFYSLKDAVQHAGKALEALEAPEK